MKAWLVEPDRLRIMVENTGVWKGRRKDELLPGEEPAPGGVGLANVRARLRAIHPGDHRVGMDHGHGRVRFHIELPARCRTEETT